MSYEWPGFGVNRFELRIAPNLRTFTGPYTPTEQVLDLLGERWQGTISLVPTVDPIEGAAREAFFDRLKGQANLFTIYHFRLPQPQGTLRDGLAGSVRNGLGATVPVINGLGATVPVVYGQPVVLGTVAQGSNTALLSCVPGYTLLAGDCISIAGQFVRVMANAIADGAGHMAVEFQGRARSTWLNGTPVVWNMPTFNARLKAGDGVPTSWTPGVAEGASFDFIEVF